MTSFWVGLGLITAWIFLVLWCMGASMAGFVFVGMMILALIVGMF